MKYFLPRLWARSTWRRSSVEAAGQVPVHVPLVPGVEPQPRPGRPDGVDVDRAEGFVPGGERPVERVAAGLAVVIGPVPGELEDHEVGPPDPSQIGALEQRVVEFLEVVKEALAEHDLEPAAPAAGVGFEVEGVFDRAAGLEDRGPASPLGLVGLDPAGDRGQ